MVPYMFDEAGALTGFGGYPYALCEPCVDVVSVEDLVWLLEPDREPDKLSWEMTPMDKPCGGD